MKQGSTGHEYKRKNREFVHGLVVNMRQFELRERFFAKDYRMLLASLRGHGAYQNLRFIVRHHTSPQRLSINRKI